GKDELYNIREASDNLCKEYELSIVQEKSAEERYTLAEQGLLKKGQPSWKDEIRQAIETTKNHAPDFDTFKKHLEQDYGIETNLRGETLSFKHPDRQRFVRANKLGSNYEMEGLQRGNERQNGAGAELERTPERNAGTQQTDDELHSCANERGLSQALDRPEPVEQIRENSNKTISNMESILTRQEQLVGKSKEVLQEVLTNGQKQLQENNSKTIEKLSELEKSNQRKLSSMNEDMNRSEEHTSELQ